MLIYNVRITQTINTFNLHVQTSMQGMISLWNTQNGNTVEVDICESLSNRELGLLTMANRLSLDMVTMSCDLVQMCRYQDSNLRMHCSTMC